ncbi:MAG: hypothetical protein WAV11_03045 [Minisyncoccia bacterium]
MKIIKLFKDLIVIILVFSLFSSSLIVFSYPQKSSANIPVIDAGSIAVEESDMLVDTMSWGEEIISAVENTATAVSTYITAAGTWEYILKEFVLDGIAHSLAQMMIRKITQDTVNWINGGFEGSPAFLDNPGEFFANTVDEALGSVLDKAGLGWLCDSFGIAIKINLAKRNYRYIPPRCSLSDMVNNVSNSLNNSSISINEGTSGGTVTVGAEDGSRQTGTPGSLGKVKVMSWGGFMKNTAKPSNTPIGAMQIAAEEVRETINESVNRLNTELDRGFGFLSWKECKVEGESECLEMGVSSIDEEGNTIPSECIQYSEPKCLQEETKTPGSVIQNQLNQSLPSDIKQLEVADEINEILSALMGQVLKQVLGATGLLGLGEKGSNGRSNIENINTQADLASLQQQQQVQQNYQDQQAQIQQGLRNQQNENAQQYSEHTNNPSAWAEANGGIFNAALKKVASQSTTQGNRYPALAVDGKKIAITSVDSTNYSSTNTGSKPWWKVDLNNYYQISQINIWAYGEDAKYIIKISDTSDNILWTSSEITFNNQTISPLNITVSSQLTGNLLPGAGLPVSGRYVTIEKTNGGSLQLIEVEVMAQAPRVAFAINNNLNVNIFKGSVQESRVYGNTLSFRSDGTISDLRLVTSLLKDTGVNTTSLENYRYINTIFDILETEIRREGVQTVFNNSTSEETISPVTRWNIANPLVEIKNNLTVEQNYVYGLFYVGVLKSSAQIPVGDYILRTEIRDKNNNTVGVQDISFSVTVL